VSDQYLKWQRWTRLYNRVISGIAIRSAGLSTVLPWTGLPVNVFLLSYCAVPVVFLSCFCCVSVGSFAEFLLCFCRGFAVSAVFLKCFCSVPAVFLSCSCRVFVVFLLCFCGVPVPVILLLSRRVPVVFLLCCYSVPVVFLWCFLRGLLLCQLLRYFSCVCAEPTTDFPGFPLAWLKCFVSGQCFVKAFLLLAL